MKREVQRTTAWSSGKSAATGAICLLVSPRRKFHRRVDTGTRASPRARPPAPDPWNARVGAAPPRARRSRQERVPRRRRRWTGRGQGSSRRQRSKARARRRRTGRAGRQHCVGDGIHGSVLTRVVAGRGRRDCGVRSGRAQGGGRRLGDVAIAAEGEQAGVGLAAALAGERCETSDAIGGLLFLRASSSYHGVFSMEGFCVQMQVIGFRKSKE